MRLTVKGQVTVPSDVRKYLDIGPHDDVEFIIDGGKVVLAKSTSPNDGLIKQLDKMKGSGHRRMTTDEIMRITRGEE